MPDIKDSVGQAASNKSHDVALVQAMLRVVNNAKGQPYLAGNYDGIYGNQTKTAILQFQKEQATASTPVPPPGGSGGAKLDALGVVSPGGATIEKLSAMLPLDYKEIRATPGLRTVYWPDQKGAAEKSASTIENDANLHPAFRVVIGQLVRLMYERHQIALTLTNTGGRRTFQKQYELVTEPKAPTQAGPGESNHNFGQAVDIGPQGWKWMPGDGPPETDR